jgi:hypothetical protein
MSLANSFKLMKLIEAEYTTQALTDTDFAKYATKQLGFDVNADHIFNRRSQMNIKATRTVAIAAGRTDNTALFELGRALEQRVAMLEKAIGMDGKGAKV